MHAFFDNFTISRRSEFFEIVIHISCDFIKWGASFRWSSSLYCPMRNSDGMTIGNKHPTLMATSGIFGGKYEYNARKCGFFSKILGFDIFGRNNLEFADAFQHFVCIIFECIFCASFFGCIFFYHFSTVFLNEISKITSTKIFSNVPG